MIITDKLPDYVQNSLSHRVDDDGYISFLRFTERQLAIYAENPFFKLMSQCSSGICLDFATDSNDVTLECRTIDLGRKMLQIKGEMSFGEILQKFGETVRKVNQAHSRLDIIQHFDVYVNGHYVDAVRIGNDSITFDLKNPERHRVQVRIWLPLYKPLSIRSLSAQGSVWPCPNRRPRLLALGDSITQGFVAGKPSFCYVTQLAELLEVDACNQGIGNMIHDARIFDDWENLPRPDLITTAYGTNDWHSGSAMPVISDAVTACFNRLESVFPGVPTYVITPIWRDDHDTPQPCGSFEDMVRLIRTAAGSHRQVRLIDGLFVSPHNPTCYSDGWLHPNIAGFSYMAPRLYREIQNWRSGRPRQSASG